MKVYIIYKHLYTHDFSQKVVGGIETYLYHLALLLQEKGLTPSIIQMSDRDCVIKQEGIIYEGFRLSQTGSWHKQLYQKIRHRISQEDIIIWGSDTFSLRINETRKTISIQHGIDFDYYPEEDKRRRWLLKNGLGHLFKLLQRRRALRVFERATTRVCVDYNFWNWYRTFCLPKEEKNIYIIPNFSQTTNRRVSFPDSTIKVLFARRFVRRRGIGIMLEVAERLSNYPVEFTFAGEGPEKEKILALQKKKQANIKLTSYEAKEALSFHSKYDIAIIPTIGSEGTSFSLLEAMAAGCVVVCSGVGGMTNIVLDQYNGYIVPPNSVQEIVDKIIYLLNHPEERTILSARAQETIEQAFSLELWKERWNKVIDNVLHS